MLVSMEEILRKAKEDNYAVSAPNVQNEDTVRAVIEVAEELNAPMIIDVNYGIAKDFVCFGQFISYLAGKSSVPIAINLDHGNNIEEIMWAVRAGFTSVMLDHSSCSYEKNVKTTKKVVDLLKPLGISVEAELGHVGQGSNYKVDGVSNLTDPKEAGEFCKKTGVSCLAVAVGTAHGAYEGEAYIDFKRLEEIKKACDVPLVLHGGSGTGDENLAKACTLGINKVNLATDLFCAGKLSQQKAYEDNSLKFFGYIPSFIEGYKEKLIHYVKLFNQAGKAKDFNLAKIKRPKDENYDLSRYL